MRALLLHLRPVHLDGKNLGQALNSLIEELKQKVPMNITLYVDPTVQLNPDAEDHLFRIAQEALSNTLRHSKADQLMIHLQHADSFVRLTFKITVSDLIWKRKDRRLRIAHDGGARECIRRLYAVDHFYRSGRIIDLWVPASSISGKGIMCVWERLNKWNQLIPILKYCL